MIEKIVTFIKEAKKELTKVKWPDKSELTDLTIAVIFATLSATLYIGIMDYIFNIGLRLLIR